MGGGGSKTHQSFTVTPGTTGEAAGDANGLEPMSVPLSPLVSAALQQIAALPDSAATGDLEAGYAALTDEAGKARALLDEAAAAGVDEAEVDAARAELRAATKAWLDQLPPEGLQQLAAASGFEHPALVGLGGGGSPLVHWLDPAYPPGIPSKAKIQAKAIERYGALCAGQSIGGLTLAAYTATNPPGTKAPGGGGEWAAAPADVVDAQSALAARLVELKAAGPAERAQAVADLIAAENHLATASCPELGSHLDIAQVAGRDSVTAALSGWGHAAKGNVALAVANGVADGALTAEEAKVLNPGEALALCRRSTPNVERKALEDAATDRIWQASALDGLVAAHTTVQPSPGGPLSLPSLTGDVGATSGKDALVGFAGDAGKLYPLVAATSTWRHAALDAGPTPYLGSPDQLTTSFRAWAKTQKVADLRDAAAALGHPQALAATRAQAQNLIASTWDPSLNAASIAAAIKPKPQPAPAKPVAPTPVVSPSKPASVSKPTGTSAPAGSTPLPPVPLGPSGKSWAAKHLQLVEALKHHTASTADLPARQDPAAVAGWAFQAAAVQSLGGAHSKSFHTAPDGTTWMFKPDKTGGGARAHAEAAASEVFAKVGVPSVPVYARTMGGKPGSIQPLLSGATNLGASPASWSQADVDAVVRYHVAAWACGDHDGKPDNLLRTAGGGLVPVDQGQAFKFFGRDTLATSYHPNGGHGVGQAVFHQAYKAAKTGGLAKGVTIRPEAALPVLAAFERLPEASYRAMLGKTAAEGAKHKVTWYEPMGARAAKTLGKAPAAVTASEVADAFLDTAVERKQNLRGAFAKFFAAEGFAGAATITKVA